LPKSKNFGNTEAGFYRQHGINDAQATVQNTEGKSKKYNMPYNIITDLTMPRDPT